MALLTHKPIVAITVGDFNGVGPEVTLKSILHPSVLKVCQPVLVGPCEVFEFYSTKLRLRLQLHPFDGAALHAGRKSIPIVESSTLHPRSIKPGTLSRRAGSTAATAIKTAVHAVKAGIVHAIVTAPVSKQALHLAGINFPGQTEMVQHLSNSPRVAMMLVSDTMRVGLATIHIPISQVAMVLTRSLLKERIDVVHDALRRDWKIPHPKVAVLGLNPHASEGGDIGREDLDIVLPVIKQFQRERLKIEGPFPADSFFGKYTVGMYDAIVAMYHDQGLIPLKMSSFGKGVNISVGLNIVRTSPDHGTAFDIAGKGVADEGSMVAAIRLAALVATNRGIFRSKKRENK